jgi:hypothetical protein
MRKVVKNTAPGRSPQHPKRNRQRRPVRGTLVVFGERVAEVLGEARGGRVMIKSIHADGVERRSAVKWSNLLPLTEQLF